MQALKLEMTILIYFFKGSHVFAQILAILCPNDMVNTILETLYIANKIPKGKKLKFKLFKFCQNS